MSHTGAPRAQYALEQVGFPFPALAALSGRASLGGPREIALASLMVARLAHDACVAALFLSAEQRRVRAAGAKHWLGAAMLPGPARAALVRLAEASGSDQKQAVAAALDSVIAVTANQLEPSARLELTKLAQAIAE